MSEDEKIPQQLNDETQKALAEKFRAEAARENAIAAKEQAWADEARAKADREIAEHRKYIEHNKEQLGILMAKDRKFHKYQYCYKISDSTVNECMDMLNYWHRTEPGCPMEIVFYSGGGEVLPGMRLFDHIRWLEKEGHAVTTVAMGFAASMGGVLLQAGNKRIMGREAYVLIHELSFGVFGDMGDVEDQVEMAKMIQRRVIDIFCSRAAKTRRPGHLTPAMMKRRWTRKDWWLDSDLCYKLGIVDEIR